MNTLTVAKRIKWLLDWFVRGVLAGVIGYLLYQILGALIAGWRLALWFLLCMSPVAAYAWAEWIIDKKEGRQP